ncbi:DNA polymerase/3'-5' exonuclease PolX [Halobacillus karajensis]|uniref:DNA-directed DNA polymerase n=1 Tax=Halobacillus karajensis TaxID=195088 RepID=A0A024P6V3_9BACI|nr:DNA polymerase/3'-5' exonuclease PolX [Halobacillus karajensis]CDQ18243.1 DNA polymerase/3'-5' exonuclease PolX [Halobacillus karajensis]CDQ24595.1 DNA polymerase/3'-5' exonuclease PolX [Halobacillus karajensis]CDQ29158.1 DNA polymerase/3'-5' exonuclease PolX [Halobacillus karajensis]
MTVDKKQVIKLLEKIAVYLELKGENPFKISAYRKAAQALERDDRSLNEIDDFTKMKGIGKGTATVIDEYLENEESDTLKQLQAEVPAGLVPLLDLPGLGGKKLAKLYQQLEVTDAESLKDSLESGKVEELEGFGKKSAEKILKALEEADSRPERLPISLMLPLAEKIESFLQKATTLKRYSRAGSLRRMRETIKDLDFIIASDNPGLTRDELLAYPDIKDIIASGETKVSIVVNEGYDIGIDFRIVAPEEFATTLHHFTGSKDHNVAMRQLAKKNNEKISEYGIENIDTGEMYTFESEEEFFKHFGLHFIPPEARENQGEVEKFKEPIELVEEQDIRGDLHMHSTWSDGAQSIREMAERAKEKGYEYIAITDHSKYLRVANGLNEKRLRLQREEINKVNAEIDDFHIFAGVEMDILPDGTLDFDDEFLEEMDFVIASIHSSFNQSEEKIMKRLTTALENPHVNMIAHPTGRLIGRRKGYDVDLEALIEGAKRTGTILELNANPNRLDLSWEWLMEAQEQGVQIAINTDAHSYPMLDHMRIGVGAARKGWLRRETVINTWTKQQLMDKFNIRMEQ